VLKDDLKQLWQYKSVAAARRFWHRWHRWLRRARASQLRPVVTFAVGGGRPVMTLLERLTWPQ